MSERDLNKIVQLEQAIVKKYGKEAIDNPKANWSEAKEKEYLEQLAKLSQKEQKTYDKVEKMEKDGFFLSKNLINKRSNRVCPICETYSFSSRDDVYVNKFQCCWNCYIKWVEGREERWLKGWRPQDEKKEQKKN